MTVKPRAALLLLLFAAGALPGCLTSRLVKRIEHGKPRHEEWARDVWARHYFASGEYLGKTSREGTEVHRFVFHQVVIWPTARVEPSIEIDLPVAGGGEPVISAASAMQRPRQGVAILYLRALSALDCAAVRDAVVRGRQSGWLQTAAARAALEVRDHPAVLCLGATVEGVGSEMLAGNFDGEKIIWSGSYVVSRRPPAFTGRWWSPMDRVGYLALMVTVPIDIATLPLQAPVLIATYLMNRGMSPR